MYFFPSNPIAIFLWHTFSHIISINNNNQRPWPLVSLIMIWSGKKKFLKIIASGNDENARKRKKNSSKKLFHQSSIFVVVVVVNLKPIFLWEKKNWNKMNLCVCVFFFYSDRKLSITWKANLLVFCFLNLISISKKK